MSQSSRTSSRSTAGRTDDIARLKQHLGAPDMVYHDFAQERRDSRVTRRWPLLAELAARLEDVPSVPEKP